MLVQRSTNVLLEKMKLGIGVKYLRKLSRWEYSGWFIAVFIGIAVTLLFEKLFILAKVFIVAAGIWAIIHWNFHQFLENKTAALNNRKVQRNPGLLKEKLFEYRAWRWGVSTVLVLFTVGCVGAFQLFEERSELESLHGYLVPANDKVRSYCSTATAFPLSRVLTIHIGKVEVFATIFPYTVLAVNNQKAIVLNRDKQGRIAISMEIRDKDGKVVVLFENGRFDVNENNFLKTGAERPDRSTLIVRDQWNNEVLNARYRNENYLEISALMRYPGAKPVSIPKNFPADICLGDAGSIALNINTN